MVALLIGLILLLSPFSLVLLFTDKKKGFIYILFFSFLLQTVLAIVSQALRIFYYQISISATLFFDLIVLLIFIRRSKFTGVKKFGFKDIDWVAIAVVIISILSLWQVHYNYTGKINLASDQVVSYHQVKNSVYPYPYFSDEWYAVSLVQGSIQNHWLPLENMLTHNFFPNIELFFHSFIAELMVVLGLDPLLQYTILSIFFNALIIVLAYLLLRIYKVSKLSSAISSLLMLYIVSGGNLPGLWQLIPFNVGIIFFLLMLCFAEINDTRLTVSAAILGSCFYAPMIPFFFLGVVVFFIKKTAREKLFKIVSATFIALFFSVPLIYIILKISPLSGLVDSLLSRIFFASFETPYTPQINFYNIIPLAAVFLAIPGLYCITKRRKWMLILEFVLGSLYWLVYSQTTSRFFVEYERTAILTSVVVVIISGFGLAYLEEIITGKMKPIAYNIFKLFQMISLLLFAILIPFYTSFDNWIKIISVDNGTNDITYPKSPANNYLTSDDLKIFQNIKNKRFLSIPWKGTVIGVATSNTPVLTKQGTISIGAQFFGPNDLIGKFLGGSCQEKSQVAYDFAVDYIYLNSSFNCPGFDKLSRSGEGLYLYKFIKES